MNNKFIVDEIRLIQAKYSLREAEAKEDDNASGGDSPVKIQIGCGYHYNKETRNLKVMVKASSNEPGLPYEFEAEMGGSFLFESQPTEKELEQLAKINCPAIVFPYLREFVSDLISRGGDEPLYLPVVNFVKFYKDSKKKKGKESKENQTAEP